MGPIETYGYNEVGPGWRIVLEALDSVIANAIMNAQVNAVALPQYRDAENTEQASITIDQLKEKFGGGLRVYYTPSGISRTFVDEIQGAVMMAERMAARTCEACGSSQDVENRGVRNQKHSWTKTFCASCHKNRDEAWLRARKDKFEVMGV